eukprot:SAG11_NODE_765_length_7275_cov_16.594203_5_plen_74_part_00
MSCTAVVCFSCVYTVWCVPTGIIRIILLVDLVDIGTKVFKDRDNVIINECVPDQDLGLEIALDLNLVTEYRYG